MKLLIPILMTAVLAFAGAAPGIEPSGTYGDAMRWYQRAAQEGLAGAQFLYGRVLEVGIEHKRDLPQAVTWYRKAAEQGHVLAQYRLGLLYYSGLSVARDIDQAVRWYGMAAQRGLAEAQFNLGLIHDRAMISGADSAQALGWYRKAALQGLGPAQLNLGLLLSDPKSGQDAADPTTGWAWLSLAAESGEDGAVKARDALTQKLMPEQMSAARARLKSLKSGPP